jgi:hypothetical protein
MTHYTSKELNDYKVSLLFDLKNESTVNYEVSYIAVEYYVGVPKEDLGEAQLLSIA